MSEVSQSPSDDLWHVKLSEDCVLEMTLDEIDTAFHAGRIDAGTAVLAPGDGRWTTLGEAAGLENAPAAFVPESVPAPYSVTPSSLAPVASDLLTPTPAPAVVDLDALGIEPDLLAPSVAPPAPRARGGGVALKAVGIVAMFAVLIATGAAGGAYAARPTEAREKIASITSRLPRAPMRAAAVAPPPPAAKELPPVETKPAAVDPPPADVKPAETAPAAQPAAAPSPESLPSVDALPDAKHASKKRKRH